MDKPSAGSDLSLRSLVYGRDVRHSKESKASLVLFGYLTFFLCLWDDALRGRREASVGLFRCCEVICQFKSDIGRLGLLPASQKKRDIMKKRNTL